MGISVGLMKTVIADLTQRYLMRMSGFSQSLLLIQHCFLLMPVNSVAGLAPMASNFQTVLIINHDSSATPMTCLRWKEKHKTKT